MQHLKPRLSPRERDAFNEGFDAAFNGECPLTGNPYLAGDDEKLGLAGCWLDGHQAYHRQQEEHRRAEHRAQRIEPKDPILARLRAMTMAEIVQRIGEPIATWPGNCLSIATAIVTKLQWTDARAVYGLYRGPLSRRCKLFRGKQGLVRHGWIVTREGVLVDPTAWVFAAEKPSLLVLVPGADESFGRIEHYDEGMESLAAVSRGPFPDARPEEQVYAVLDTDLRARLQREVRMHWLGTAKHIGARAPESFTLRQLAWLCRTPYTVWGTEHASALYQFVKRLGHESLAPIDYRSRAARDAEWGICLKP